MQSNRNLLPYLLQFNWALAMRVQDKLRTLNHAKDKHFTHNMADLTTTIWQKGDRNALGHALSCA